MENIYNVNETMRMLGKQDNFCELFKGNGEIRKKLKDIQEARANQFVMDAAFDIFMLGYIYGKREERKRRNRLKGVWENLTDISTKLYRAQKLIGVFRGTYGFDCAELSDNQIEKIRFETNEMSALLDVIDEYVFDGMKIVDKTLEEG